GAAVAAVTEQPPTHRHRPRAGPAVNRTKRPEDSTADTADAAGAAIAVQPPARTAGPSGTPSRTESSIHSASAPAAVPTKPEQPGIATITTQPTSGNLD
ncbi:hypothetical protein, partial [Mycobacterium tuberculosis]|uniref:hypothetical protein n=5 Tax=Mycobacterium tuberculosis TaxID=1773 RepID=UPI002351E5D2